MTRVASARTGCALVAFVVVLTMAAGCARPGANDAGPGGSWAIDGGGSVGAAGESCDSGGNPNANPPTLTPLPADAVLVSAARCLFEPQPVPGDGEWLMRTEQKATTGLEALAAALRLPSEQVARGQGCPAIAYPPIVITVVDTTGREIHPQVPHTACGAPLKAVTDAIAGLTWTPVGTTKVRQTRSELEVSSGCSGAWKPVIPLIAAEGSGTQVVGVDTAGRAMRVCRYDLDPDPGNVISIGNGTAYRSGKLVAASTLDATAGAELLKAVASAPRATGSCGQPEQPFAVVHAADGTGPWIAIERGGCYRALMDAENYLRQLDAALVSRLVG